MEMFIHKGRNVVVKRGENGDKWDVSFVGVAETVEGAKRRGRYPNYAKTPVKASELVAFESPSEKWVELAKTALSADEAAVAEDAGNSDMD